MISVINPQGIPACDYPYISSFSLPGKGKRVTVYLKSLSNSLAHLDVIAITENVTDPTAENVGVGMHVIRKLSAKEQAFVLEILDGNLKTFNVVQLSQRGFLHITWPEAIDDYWDIEMKVETLNTTTGRTTTLSLRSFKSCLQYLQNNVVSAQDMLSIRAK